MFNWDSILMVINYMLCNDKITYSWAGIGKYFSGGSWVWIFCWMSYTCQPRSQTLSPLPPSVTREAKKREPGIMVGYMYPFKVFFFRPNKVYSWSYSLSVAESFDQWCPDALAEDSGWWNWDNKQAWCNICIKATLMPKWLETHRGSCLFFFN